MQAIAMPLRWRRMRSAAECQSASKNCTPKVGAGTRQTPSKYTVRPGRWKWTPDECVWDGYPSGATASRGRGSPGEGRARIYRETSPRSDPAPTFGVQFLEAD